MVDPFSRLPEVCISEILSHTSVSDASRSSLTSKAFKSASESNLVWESFLPSDYREILSRSVHPVNVFNKKDLFLSLVDDPILIDGGKMSFSLDKRNGKKCFMLGARELLISWKACWDLTSHELSRFREVAKLRSIGWIHIQGKIKTKTLSKDTNYAAYLVYWLEKIDGLKSSNTLVRILSNCAPKTTSKDHFESRETGKIARKRCDGWMEIELGKFYVKNKCEDDEVVEAWLIEIHSPHGKCGLTVEGIEFRPV